MSVQCSLRGSVAPRLVIKGNLSSTVVLVMRESSLLVEESFRDNSCRSSCNCCDIIHSWPAVCLVGGTKIPMTTVSQRRRPSSIAWWVAEVMSARRNDSLFAERVENAPFVRGSLFICSPYSSDAGDLTAGFSLTLRKRIKPAQCSARSPRRSGSQSDVNTKPGVDINSAPNNAKHWRPPFYGPRQRTAEWRMIRIYHG